MPDIRYAIVQKSLEPPPVKTLEQAFKSLDFLTTYDAHILANDAFGILVKNLSSDDALAVHRALAVAGVETERIPENELPLVPDAKLVRRAECSPEGFMIYDPSGRKFPVEWRHVTLIATGNVRLSEFKTTETTRRVIRYRYGGNPHVETLTERNRREEQNLKLILEVILGQGVARFSFAAEKFVYRNPGTGVAKATHANFRRFVRDVLLHAPHAFMNRGACQILKSAGQFFAYPSKNAFFEEITWLLWRMKRAARS